jgi:flagellar motor switch protein FliG
MAKTATKGLTGREKVAILMVALGNEVAAEIYKRLDDATIEIVTLEIANLRKVTPEQRLGVLKDAQEMLLAREYMARGGVDYARDILERALGPERAQNLLTRITASLQVRPFDFMRHTDAQQILGFIQGEHPQTVAVMGQDFTLAGGIDAIVDIINNADRATERNIMEHLEENDPELAEEIKRRLFVFEDIIKMDDRSLQRVLREVEMKELSLALKGATEELRGKFFKNMSKRASEMLKEDMDYMGPVRVKDVEEAQQKVVNVVRALEDVGEIVISRGGEEELVV